LYSVANSKLALQEFQNASRPGTPNSKDFENHISWDFAEAVQIPYSSQQEVKIKLIIVTIFTKLNFIYFQCRVQHISKVYTKYKFLVFVKMELQDKYVFCSF